MRDLPDVEWIPCRFNDKTTGACTVYDIRPAMCRNFLGDHLKIVISLLNLSEEAAPPE